MLFCLSQCQCQNFSPGLLAQAQAVFAVGALICVAIAFALFVFAIPFFLAFIRTMAVRDSFRTLARKYVGTYYSNGWFQFPEVAFRQAGILYRVRLTASRQNRLKKVLMMTANWRDQRFRMRLVPGKTAYSPAERAKIPERIVGDRAFDEAFYLQSNAEEDLSHLFNQDVKSALLKQLTRRRNVEAELLVVGGVMILRRRANFSTGKDLISNVEGFVKIHQLMLAALAIADGPAQLTEDEIRFLPEKQERIEIRDDIELKVVAEQSRTPVCQVCGCEILEEQVECRSCDTAHHRDCWEYNGKCSTFACGEHRIRKKTRRLPKPKSSESSWLGKRMENPLRVWEKRRRTRKRGRPED